MTFTDDQMGQIRKYQCANKLFLNSQDYNYPLEARMALVGADPISSAVIVIALTDLATIDAQIDKLETLAFVTTADKFDLDGPKGIRALEKRGRQKIGIISDALALEPLSDYFAARKTSAQRGFH